MIEYPTKQQIVELIKREQGRCVSILMPTHESGRETNQNSIRFKNLLSDASEKTADLDDDAANRLRELQTLQNDVEFWRHQSAGLAIFVCDGFQEIVKLDHQVEESVYVADHFFIKPLAAAACDQSGCYALAISWEQARLFHATANDAREIIDDSFPALMDDLVLERDDEEQLQLSSHRAHGQGSGPTDVAMYHGHGEGEEKIEADRNNYLIRVGRLINDLMYNQGRPLMLIATEEVAGHFASATDVEIASVIHTSPDGLTDSQLTEKICESVEQQVGEGDEELLHERLGAALAGGTGSNDVAEIVLAASNGRIDTLLLSTGKSCWGSVDRDQQKVSTSSAGTDNAVDLINVAVHDTLAAGGDIHSCEQDHPVAAIYRY